MYNKAYAWQFHVTFLGLGLKRKSLAEKHRSSIDAGSGIEEAYGSRIRGESSGADL